MAKKLSDMESIASTLGEVAETLKGIEITLEEMSKRLGNFEKCIDDRTKLKVIRVADITRKP